MNWNIMLEYIRAIAKAIVGIILCVFSIKSSHI